MTRLLLMLDGLVVGAVVSKPRRVWLGGYWAGVTVVNAAALK